jgi:hypothetical protein
VEMYSPNIRAFQPLHLGMPANNSLNRTHCGMRPKARHFILGL